MVKILSTHPLPGAAFERLQAAHTVILLEDTERERGLEAELAEAEVLITQISLPITKALLDAAPKLRIIASYGVGTNHIAVEWATLREIPVLNTPNVLTDASADLAFGLLLSATRRITEGDRLIRAGGWQGSGPSFFLGPQVTGKTLGIVGMGRIGQAMARRARGFAMPILYHNRKRLSLSLEREYGATYLPLHELLAACDILSLHCPLTPDTRHLIRKETLALMKPTAVLVNTARGAVVCEEDLAEALASKRLAAAGLDVFEDEPHPIPALLALPNVVLSPHIGSATFETRSAMTELLVSGIHDLLQGKIPLNVVNPEIYQGKLPPPSAEEE